MRNTLRVFLSVLLCAAFALAQSVTGRISGTVVDATGAAVPGATVELQLAGGGLAASTNTTSDGLFSFIGIRPDMYAISVQAKGFSKKVLRDVNVDPGRETALANVPLEVGSQAEVVEVSESAQGIQTANAEISTTITREQMQRLPLLNRSPLALIGTQAGVTYNGRSSTTVNGQRPSYSNVTVDGVNVQDNFIRTNALDFLPNLLLLDQVSEMTVMTANSSAAVGGGASQVIISTPSGNNGLHGGLTWINRNKAFAANDWFNNRDGISLPPYNQNQLGGRIGGRIIRDKLFYYANFEAYRLHQQSSANRTLLTADARQGNFTYRDTSSSTVRKANVLQLFGATADSAAMALVNAEPGADKINNTRVGDSSDALLRNTAGYAYTLRNNRIRNNLTGKADYLASTKHIISGTFTWNSDLLDRTVQTTNFDGVPPVKNDNKTKLMSVTWRWNPTPSITNEARFGFNLAPGLFVTTNDIPKAFASNLLYSNPVNTFMPQGRYANAYNMQDNANYVRGRHNFQFGFQGQMTRIRSYDYASTVPTYTLSLGTARTGLAASQFPGGISATDLSNANTLLANLAGFVSAYTQSFQVKDRTSGYVAGQPNERNFRLNNWAGYFQDNWKIKPRLTLNLGIRWDYYSPVDERDALALLPVLINNNVIQTLMSNAILDFAGNAVGRSWYGKDYNNFAPVVGLAWDVFGNGKTAVRAGYSISYVNDDLIRTADNNTGTNAGLAATSSRSGLSGFLSSPPAVAVPAYKVPRTFADNFAINTSSNAESMPDPNLRMPYVQQFTLGIQQKVKGAVVELRYIGNHSTKAWRAFDYNQVVINENGFLGDFKKAYNNGLLAQRAGKGFLPAYDASIAGSQQLPVFNQLGSALLTNSTIVNLIQTQQVGDLASTYFTNGLNGNVQMFRNPYGLGMNTISNYSNASYNALQIDIRKQTTKGLYLQGNYTWSKNLGDAGGDQQTRFEPFLDINNAKLERARTQFDLRHQLKINGSYDLPLGKGHRLSGGPLQKLVGGWFMAGNFTAQSGSPFSVLSARGTLNRAARSGQNTVDTSLSYSQLNDLFQFRQTGIGPYFFAASALGSDGRAVAGDTLAAFNGQAFSQPEAGDLGALQRRMFSSPGVWNLDMAFGKVTHISERHVIEIRMEATNFFNHPTWYIGDQTVTSSQFGRITTTFYDRRLIQFGANYRF